MRKWYAGGFINYNSLTVKSTFSGNGVDPQDSKATISIFGGGIMFGHQWLLGAKENFVIDLNLGAGYQTASVSGNDDEDIQYNLAASGVWPKLSFALGYAF